MEMSLLFRLNMPNKAQASNCDKLLYNLMQWSEIHRQMFVSNFSGQFWSQFIGPLKLNRYPKLNICTYKIATGSFKRSAMKVTLPMLCCWLTVSEAVLMFVG